MICELLNLKNLNSNDIKNTWISPNGENDKRIKKIILEKNYNSIFGIVSQNAVISLNKEIKNMNTNKEKIDIFI